MYPHHHHHSFYGLRIVISLYVMIEERRVYICSLVPFDWPLLPGQTNPWTKGICPFREWTFPPGPYVGYSRSQNVLLEWPPALHLESWPHSWWTHPEGCWEVAGQWLSAAGEKLGYAVWGVHVQVCWHSQCRMELGLRSQQGWARGVSDKVGG